MEQSFLTTESNRLTTLVSNALLKFETLSGSVWNQKPAPEKWSKKEILGHLIDSAANNHLRFVRAQLAEHEFVSFAYEQNFFVTSQRYQDLNVSELILFWKAYNSHLAHILSCMHADKLQIMCKIGTYEPVTLAFLVKDYNDHLAHHLDAIFQD